MQYMNRVYFLNNIKSFLLGNRVGEMFHWLRALSALTEYPVSVPRTHIKPKTTTFNSNSRGSDVFWSLGISVYMCICPYIDLHTFYIMKMKKRLVTISVAHIINNKHYTCTHRHLLYINKKNGKISKQDAK